MAETKPTKVAEWATDANRTLEPTAGEKGTGWVLGERPPARHMNWLQNVVYQWFNWFNERFFDGAAAEDLEVTGVDIATGVDQEGGNLRLSGGSSTGDGGSEIEFQLAKAGQGAGAAVRTPATVVTIDETGLLTTEGIEAASGITDEPGVGATGNGTGAGVIGNASGSNNASIGVEGAGNVAGAATASVGVKGVGAGTGVSHGVMGEGAGSGSGVTGDGGATNGLGVYGRGTGTGAGVHGKANTEGYGVIAEGRTNPTTAGRASLQIMPQTGVPATLNNGAMWIQNDTNLVYIRINGVTKTFTLT